LAACGGGGYGGGGMSMPVMGVGPSKLFAADSTDMAIGSLANPNPATGSLMVDRTITGSFYVQLSTNIGSLALDTVNDRLYVGNGTTIPVFNNASTDNGDVFRSGTITSNPAIGNTGSMFLDAVHDSLYVGDDVVEVKVFSPASTLTGLSTPRHITGMTTPIHGVAVDTGTNNILYVSNENAGTHQISVFDNADTVTNAAPSRTIVPTVSGVNLAVGGIAFDATHDLLYVAPGAGANGIMVFSTPNTAHGMIAPTQTLTITSAPGILKVVVDGPNDRLYAVGSNGHVYLIEVASTLTSGNATAKDASLSNGGMLTAVAVNPN
ncbi:MAG TPA: hypothetical protein VFI80_07420, partial [Burkholderiales bacterium]|nr:hypothetical protein [Burkholderiales bacterium]